MMMKHDNSGRTGGFTLMELLVAIAVLAILATLSVPSVQDVMRSNQVTGQTNEMISMLNFARNMAIRNSGDVTVSFDAGTDGWSGIVEDPDGDGSAECTTAGALRCVDGEKVLLTSSANGDIEFTFDKRGYLKDAAFLTDGNVTIETLWLEHRECSGDRHRRRIEIRPTGQVSACRVDCGNTSATC